MPNLFSQRGIFLSALVFFILSYGFDVMYPIHRIIYVISFAALLNFLRVIDLRFALPELISFITILMYITAPALMFDLGSQKFMNSAIFGYDILAVDPGVYYSFAIPSTLVFYVVITFSFHKYRSKEFLIDILEKINERYDIKKMIILFGIISFISSLLSGSIASLNYIFSLGSSLLTVILVLSLLLESGRTKKIIFSFVSILLVLNALRTGMFSELVFSLIFYALFWVLINGLSVKLKFLLPFIGILFLIILQAFKNDFRDQAWSKYQSQDNFNIGLDVLENINQNLSINFLEMSTTFTLKRLNQAYLSSRVLEHIPEKEDFANGESIVAAFYSLIPRILWPDKPVLSGRELMIKYGNYRPSTGTSMSVGQLGESYANFGYFGGILFFGVYGIFISYILYFLMQRSSNGKPYIVFVSIVMYHMAKPEVIYSKAFNTAFKGILFFIIMLFIINNFCLREEYES